MSSEAAAGDAHARQALLLPALGCRHYSIDERKAVVAWLVDVPAPAGQLDASNGRRLALLLRVWVQTVGGHRQL